MNRSLSIRSNKQNKPSPMRHGFHFSSLRGTIQSGLSKKLYKMIKLENHLISSYRAAARDRIDIANQLSIWGESTDDKSISDISDKIGVLLSEIGEQEDHYANKLESSRGILKMVRDTEKSVQPSRDFKSKISDEIAKLKAKEPESTRLVTLEQELVRAEAENLVAEAQLTNITRKKMKEAYSTELAATIERAEKHIILARHGCRLLSLLDDSPITPGDQRQTFEYTSQARQVLNDAEDDLKDWQLDTQIFNSDPSFDAQHMPNHLNQSHQINNCTIESDGRELSRARTSSDTSTNISNNVGMEAEAIETSIV